jgi:hypothetical protein
MSKLGKSKLKPQRNAGKALTRRTPVKIHGKSNGKLTSNGGQSPVSHHPPGDFLQRAMPDFSLPDLPSFEMPVPAVWRDFAESSVAQCNANFRKITTAADETANVFERFYRATARAYADCGAMMVAAAHTNAIAAVELAEQMLVARSLPELAELSSIHVRAQFDALNTQSKSLAVLAQKIASGTVEPMRKSLTAAVGASA